MQILYSWQRIIGKSTIQLLFITIINIKDRVLDLLLTIINVTAKDKEYYNCL